MRTQWSLDELPGLGLDWLPMDAISSNDPQSAPERSGEPDARVMAEDAMGLFRNRLGQQPLMSREEEQAIGREMEELFRDMVAAMLGQQSTAEDFLVALGLLLSRELKIDMVADRPAYFALRRELKDLRKAAKNRARLEALSQQADEELGSRRGSSGVLSARLRQQIAAADWNGPLLLAMLGRFLSDPPSTLLASALDDFVLFHGGPSRPSPDDVAESRRRRLQQLSQRYFELRNTFVSRNLRLVLSIVNRYCGRQNDFLELAQEGTLGLIRAAEMYRVGTGNRFSTYAYNWIDAKVRAARVNLNGGVVPVSPEVNGEISRLLTTLDEFRRTDRRPTPAALAEAMGSKEERVRMLMRLKRAFVSMDQTVGDESEMNLHGSLPDPDSSVAGEVDRLKLSQRMRAIVDSSLSEREAFVLSERYGLRDRDPKTLAVVARLLGLSGESVRQLEKSALHKLRQVLGASGEEEQIAESPA